MAIKYFLQYNDVENIVHRLEIEDSTYTGDEIEVFGTITLDYAETDKTLEAIRGNGLKVDLEASEDRKFTELFTSAEMTYQVNYQRNSEVLFRGWINPEGYYESFVADKWYVSIDCVDGLGFLKDLSYVNNSTGVSFSGKQSQLEVIVNCLKRTGLTQNIYTNIDIYYTGLSTSLDVLDNVYVNTERFIKDDDETIMSCDEVLRDTLESYAACITMHLGNWYIYKPNQLYLDQSPTFFGYDSDGVALSPTTYTLELLKPLGSQINNFYPHHANKNQSLSLDRPIGAYRINYKYGFATSLISNIYLFNSNTLPSITISGWTINSTTNLTGSPDYYGVYLESIISGSDVKNMTSAGTTVSSGDLLSYRLKYELISFVRGGGLLDPGFFQYKIILSGASTYYWDGSDWTLTNTTLEEYNKTVIGEVYLLAADFTAAPIAGDIIFEIYTPVEDPTSSVTTFHLQEVSLNTQQTGNAANIKGEFHTVEREDSPSTKVEDNKKVYTGDNPSEVYVGALYKTDESTTTETWSRKGFTEDIPICQLMGEETLRANSENSTLFSGDIYGYLPYLSVVTIDNVDGLFMLVNYSYNTKSNIINCKFKRIFGDELTDILYTLTFDYGNTTKPTIKG